VDRPTDLAVTLKSGLGEAKALHGKLPEGLLCLLDHDGPPISAVSASGLEGAMNSRKHQPQKQKPGRKAGLNCKYRCR
jgi:hypothetical protein